MMDFTHNTYRRLLETLQDQGYTFLTFRELARSNGSIGAPYVLLRHDVDRMPGRSQALAELESQEGVQSTYFFRTKPVSFSEAVIARIQALGHEIGYHYETLSDAKGDMELAWQLFAQEVKKFQRFGGVESIAMHGRPFSPWDNRALWERFDYRSLGIRLEAYVDIDWSQFLYLTDTGRSWNGKDNFRDHASGTPKLHDIHTIKDIIKIIRGERPNLIISTHPERWTGSVAGWLQVLITDSAINILKRTLKLVSPNGRGGKEISRSHSR